MQFQTSSIAQVACALERRDCSCIRCRGAAHFTADVISSQSTSMSLFRYAAMIGPWFDGTGTRLRIRRSIVESRGGHLSPAHQSSWGAGFYSTLPSIVGVCA